MLQTLFSVLVGTPSDTPLSYDLTALDTRLLYVATGPNAVLNPWDVYSRSG